MKIRILKPCTVNLKSRQVGDELEVKDSVGYFLRGNGQAVQLAPDAPAQEEKPAPKKKTAKKKAAVKPEPKQEVD